MHIAYSRCTLGKVKRLRWGVQKPFALRLLLCYGGPHGHCRPRLPGASQAIDPPPELSLRNAVELLQNLGALDDEEDLTDLGARLANISIDPRYKPHDGFVSE